MISFNSCFQLFQVSRRIKMEKAENFPYFLKSKTFFIFGVEPHPVSFTRLKQFWKVVLDGNPWRGRDGNPWRGQERHRGTAPYF